MVVFNYGQRRQNPTQKRVGSTGWPDGWNTLPNPASLKDSELSELINGIYSQYGTISKRQGCQIVGSRMEDTDDIINGGMFYDINGQDYMLRINSLGKVERFNFSTEVWSVLAGTPPAAYSGTDPAFEDNSPVFNTSVFTNIVQSQGRLYFANSEDRMVVFDGTAWKIWVELPDPTTRPTVAKTGSGTGTRTYFYRYCDLNEFGATLASPANDGGQTNGQGFFENMPEIDGSTYLTVTLPDAPTGTVRRMIFRGDVAENEFFRAEVPANQNTFIDKNTPQAGQPAGEDRDVAAVNFMFTVPEANTTAGFHFHLLESYKDMLVGTTTEFGKDVLVWSGEPDVNITGGDVHYSFALPDGAGFDDYHRGDGQSINALQAFSVANEDGLAVFKDSRVGLLKPDPLGGFNIQNVNVIRGTLSPKAPHVAGNDIRFYSSEGVASLGHAENFGTILRYSVLSLKASGLTDRVTPANLSYVCSEYFKNLSLFGVSTGTIGSGNSSILVYDERYNTWSHWTGLHPAILWKGKHPSTKIEDLYFGVSNASAFGGNVVKMFTGKTDYATSTGSGNRITLSLSTKQYDAKLPDKFKNFDRAVIVFGSLFGNRTTAQAIGMGPRGITQYPRFKVTTDPVLSGFGNDEWGNQEMGMMLEDDAGEVLNIRYINLRQRDLYWIKLNIQNDGMVDEMTLLGVYFYFAESDRQMPGRARLVRLA